MDKAMKRRGIWMTAALLASALLLSACATRSIQAGEQPHQAEAEQTKLVENLFDDQPQQVTAEQTRLAKDLIGTWALVEAETPGRPSGVGIRLKSFTGTHWMITQPDPKTGQVLFHHGGRYTTLDGDTMAESVDFANKSTAQGIGRTQRYKIEFSGNTLKQIGLGNRWTATWKRVK